MKNLAINPWVLLLVVYFVVFTIQPLAAQNPSGNSSKALPVTLQQKATTPDSLKDESQSYDTINLTGIVGAMEMIVADSFLDQSWEAQKAALAQKLLFFSQGKDDQWQSNRLELVFYIADKKRDLEKNEILTENYNELGFSYLTDPDIPESIEVFKHTGGAILDEWSFYRYQIAELVTKDLLALELPFTQASIVTTIVTGAHKKCPEGTHIFIQPRLLGIIPDQRLEMAIDQRYFESAYLPLVEKLKAMHDFEQIENVKITSNPQSLTLKYSNYESTITDQPDVVDLQLQMGKIISVLQEHKFIQRIDIITKTSDSMSFLDNNSESITTQEVVLTYILQNKRKVETIPANSSINILQQEVLKLQKWKTYLTKDDVRYPIDLKFMYDQKIEDLDTQITIRFK